MPCPRYQAARPHTCAGEPILAALDAWLDILTDPDHIDATVAAIVAADEAGDPEPVELVQARRQCQRLERELDRMVAAIRAIQAEIAAARATILASFDRTELAALYRCSS